ncbi:hypothetical protein [Mucilaginibacter sp. FT3.2]|uniref:hypothetical protein n=1 Tax=Mucilaginibacter sp. FT3.2 TaxID=2723090 RepID=UPI00161AC8B7|nr:hypothetical protein [Mucilaginibacter sp. FT3.2]MBB6231803.1 alpha-N-acetylglucosamine transferase [Mucilaginibacter sp. FT3.2]
MRVTQRMLSVSLIVLVLLILILSFGWINGMVSYKYEVQDAIFAGKSLNQHQKDILNGITSSKVGVIVGVGLLIFVLYINSAEPTLGGRVYYVDKDQNQN